jgi:hypothetical protein
MPCLLSSKPQSFSPQFFTNESNCNLFLLPLKRENEDFTNILMLHGSQIVLFDSKDLTVKEEILLESQIEAFRFEQNELTLKICNKKLEIDSTKAAYTDNGTCEIGNDDYTADTIADTIADAIADTSIDITDINSNTIATNTNSDIASSIYSDTIYKSTLTTITSKNCTWTISSSIFTLNFSSSQLTCQAAVTTNLFDNFNFPIFEIIKNDHLFRLTTENELQILSKTDRKIISVANVPTPLLTAKSLIWINHEIFVFSIDSVLKVFKFNLMKFVPPTNVSKNRAVAVLNFRGVIGLWSHGHRIQ